MKMTTTGRNKPSEVPSQTSRHKHKRKKNTEFSWPHTKLDSLMTMAREAPIRHQGWALLEDAHRSSASLCVMETCVPGRVKAYCMHFFRSDSQASQLKSVSFLQQGNVHINSLSWTVWLWPSTVVRMGESKLCGPLWIALGSVNWVLMFTWQGLQTVFASVFPVGSLPCLCSPCS